MPEDHDGNVFNESLTPKDGAFLTVCPLQRARHRNMDEAEKTL